MKKNEFLSKVQVEIKEAQKRKEEAEEALSFYGAVRKDGEDYALATFAKKKAEKELLFLEQIADLPEILYIKYASDEKLNTLKEAKLQEIRACRHHVIHTITMGDIKIDGLSNAEKELIASYFELLKSDEADADKAKKLTDLLSKGSDSAKSKDQIREEISESKDKLSFWNNNYNRIVSLPLEGFRNILIDSIKDSNDTIDIAEELKAGIKKYRVFASVSNSPDNVNILADLLTEYRGKNIVGPKPVIYDNTTVDGQLLPEKLEKRIFNNPEVFCSKILINPDKAIEIIKEYKSKVLSQASDYYTLSYQIGEIGTALVALNNYELECKKANRDEIVYGDVNNTEAQDAVLDFFERNQTFPLIMHNGGIPTKEISKVDSMFDGYSAPIFFRRKSEIEFKKTVVSEQIKLYRKRRDYLRKKFFELDHLPLVEAILYQRADNDDFRNGLVDAINGLVEMLDKLLVIFERLKNEFDSNNHNFLDELEEVAKKIGDIARCKEVDQSTLLIDGDRDALIDQIYEYAAVYKAAQLVTELEDQALQISVREEAQELGISEAELTIRKQNQLRALYEAKLKEKDEEIERLNGIVETFTKGIEDSRIKSYSYENNGKISRFFRS
ncbi:MAG: hypothetical protein IKP98_03140 [Bacilli bacterium]|nr:hypothetical protein [Bacilli bacterium]